MKVVIRGDKLFERMMLNGVNVSSLARRSGVSRTTITRILQAGREGCAVHVETVYRLAHALGVPSLSLCLY